MDDAEADLLFFALSDRTRRAMLDHLKHAPGATVGELCAPFPMSRIAAMKHLRVLEAACLVTSERDGRARRLHLNVIPLQRVYDRWTTEWSAEWARGLTALKARLEADFPSPPPPPTRRTRT